VNARHRKPAKSGIGSRQWWTKQLHSWHWISAGLSLVGMLFFAITGITLNHAGAFDAAPVVDRSARLPAALLPALAAPPADPRPPARPGGSGGARGGGVDVAGRAAEWASDAITVNLPRPGGDGFVSINPADGAITAESTDRGLLSLANDLHKGRNAAWVWFIDIFAAACVVFTSPGCCCCKSTPSGARSPGPSWRRARWCRWC
jgi:hypothetical protein